MVNRVLLQESNSFVILFPFPFFSFEVDNALGPEFAMDFGGGAVTVGVVLFDCSLRTAFVAETNIKFLAYCNGFLFRVMFAFHCSLVSGYACNFE